MDLDNSERMFSFLNIRSNLLCLGIESTENLLAPSSILSPVWSPPVPGAAMLEDLPWILEKTTTKCLQSLIMSHLMEHS